MIIVATIVIYFGVLMLFSRLTGRSATNATFFRGDRESPWYMVAFGMVGASMSGITYVSVPGMVMGADMTYLQTCLGFIPGYFLVAFVLLPIYYRLNLTSIYSYLDERLGVSAYKVGASFFLLSKMLGASLRFYLVCMILQTYVFDSLGVPFVVSVVCLTGLIWVYTRRGGIKTLVWTDTFQTACMLASVVLITKGVADGLGLDWSGVVKTVRADEMSRVFVFDDWLSKQNFWKQFVGGAFIVVVMTGLDQDMMQKNLTCKTLRDAQKDMCTSSFIFLPVNLLLLTLGVLLVHYAGATGTELPTRSDDLLPMFAASGALGTSVVVFFTIGIVASSFSSADSALTALTTSYCVDIRGREGDEQLRKRTHLAMTAIFIALILVFRAINSGNALDAVFTLCSYTYGPLLGLFCFGLFTKWKPRGRAVPIVCVLSPLICLGIDFGAEHMWGYIFGYELLLVNAGLTFAGLAATRR